MSPLLKKVTFMIAMIKNQEWVLVIIYKKNKLTVYIDKD